MVLNRKKLERADHGKVYFYEPRSATFDEKLELLRLMDVEILDCGFDKGDDDLRDYKPFYNAAIQDIQERIAKD